MNSQTNKAVSLSLFLGTALLLSLSQTHVTLTVACCLLPLLGLLCKNLRRSTGLIALFFSVKAVFFVIPVTCGIPTALSALSLSLTYRSEGTPQTKIYDFLLHVLFPLACMAIFTLRTTGNAFLYSFYWLIPPIIYGLESLFAYRLDFLRMLKSSFIAHAAGSVIWLFLVPMTTERWIALIPVVMVERLLFASILLLIFYTATATKGLIKFASSGLIASALQKF